MRKVYLDNAATTPISEEVLEAMIPIFKEYYGNPSSIHGEGRKVRNAIEHARKTVANYIGSSIGEIFFTSGGTESNNMAIKCAVRDLGVRRVITSKIEHHCILHTVEHLDPSVEVIQLDVDEKGRISFKELEKLLQDNTKKTLVSLMYANNEIGTLLGFEKISALCEEYGTYFHSDTVQAIGHFPIDVSKHKVHFLSGSAHKFHGPKGAGFIYINGDAKIKPMIDGGAQERNMRAGTENVYGIVGLAKALTLAIQNMEKRRQHIESLRSYFIEQLEENFVGIEFNGDYDGDYLYTVLSVSFPPNAKSDMMIMMLDINGIAASGGSACSSGAEQGSHVLAALNAPEDRKTVRFSFSHYNTKEEIDLLVAGLKRAIRMLS